MKLNELILEAPSEKTRFLILPPRQCLLQIPLGHKLQIPVCQQHPNDLNGQAQKFTMSAADTLFMYQFSDMDLSSKDYVINSAVLHNVASNADLDDVLYNPQFDKALTAAITKDGHDHEDIEQFLEEYTYQEVLAYSPSIREIFVKQGFSGWCDITHAENFQLEVFVPFGKFEAAWWKQ